MDFWDLNPHVLDADECPRSHRLARRGMVGLVLDGIGGFEWRAIRLWVAEHPGAILSRRVADSDEGLATWSCHVWFPAPPMKVAFVAFVQSLPARQFIVDFAPDAMRGAWKAARLLERAGQNIWLRERWDSTFAVEFAGEQQALAFAARWRGRLSTIEEYAAKRGAAESVGPTPCRPADERFRHFRRSSLRHYEPAGRHMA